MKKAIIKSGIRLKNGIIIFLLSLFTYSALYAQKEDNKWMVGYYSPVPESFFCYGLNIFDFTSDPVIIGTEKKIPFRYDWTCSLFAIDSSRYLYSNGMQIFDQQEKPIENGEKINYNSYWQKWVLNTSFGPVYDGLRLPQGMIMLPYPDRDSVVWLAYNRISETAFEEGYSKGMFYGIIDVSSENGKVTLKDKLITSDTLTSSSLQACKHANGRDWWILTHSLDHKKFYFFLLDPFGLRLHHIQEINLKYRNGLGQANFSPDGSKYAIAEIEDDDNTKSHIFIFDFNRSTGTLSHYNHQQFSQIPFIAGCSFSYDSKWLYVSAVNILFQFDIQASNPFLSQKNVAISDEFESYFSSLDGVKNFFGLLALAPDGKIYGPGGNTLHMHRIEYPDEEGTLCQVSQHAIYTVANANTIPNFPNFRLGPLDGSPADTLGLDNNPIAKYRYEADTTNHLNVRFTDLSYYRPEQWTWDFGDGTTFDGRKPYWHTFPKNGTYNVCLTVSNENSSNTSCRLITIGTNAADEVLPQKDIVSIFPNPVETEMLLTISEYIPEHGVVEVYDVMGKMVYNSRVYYGWNNIDLAHLINGTYFYKVKDKGHQLHAGQFVKIAK